MGENGLRRVKMNVCVRVEHFNPSKLIDTHLNSKKNKSLSNNQVRQAHFCEKLYNKC